MWASRSGQLDLDDWLCAPNLRQQVLRETELLLMVAETKRLVRSQRRQEGEGEASMEGCSDLEPVLMSMSLNACST
jgi:hypothetical protein